MTVALPVARAAASPWRAHLIALGMVWAAMLALFHRDVADIATIWWADSTYTHCLLILPIIAWLVWQRLPQLALLTPAAWTGGLVLVAGRGEQGQGRFGKGGASLCHPSSLWGNGKAMVNGRG